MIDRAGILRPLIAPGASGAELVALICVWLAVLVASVAAAWCARWWLVIPVTALVMISTALLAIPLIPFMWRLLAPEQRPFVMLIVNGVVLLAAVALSIALRPERARHAGVAGTTPSDH